MKKKEERKKERKEIVTYNIICETYVYIGWWCLSVRSLVLGQLQHMHPDIIRSLKSWYP